MSISVNVDIKEIYRLVCKECRRKIKNLIQNKITEQLASQILEEEEKPTERD
jgi:ATP-dependent Clp protease ATP-binding subunit ClpA